ncbi:MAG TPA: hypothetical protein VFW12_05605 [Candidatus Limnocylindria bacterium]|nr:hypothetical protein [Candidatus Limnocylindria bacterium]
MRQPYPVDVVPLLPKFLSGKRLPADWIPRAAQELGIDRPAILMALLIERAGDAGLPERSAYSVYTTKLDASAPALAAAQGAGLIAKRDERWHATDAGRDLAGRLRRASDEHLGSLAAERADDFRRLADLLERAFQASVRAPEPAVKERLPLGLGFRRAHQASSPLAAVDQAVYGLWMFRDDCHIAAWRGQGFDGPTLDVLTRLWREGPATRDELVPLLVQQRPEDVDAALERLRRDGRVEPGSLRLTARGRSDRDAIESETDRLFFAPWPEAVGAEGPWIRERLEEAVAAIS